MAHYSNKTCERCGYKTHRLFDVSYEGVSGICADCVVDYLLRMDKEDEDGVLNFVEDIVVSDVSEEL